MKDACEAFRRWDKGQRTEVLKPLHPPDTAVFLILLGDRLCRRG